MAPRVHSDRLRRRPAQRLASSCERNRRPMAVSALKPSAGPKPAGPHRTTTKNADSSSCRTPLGDRSARSVATALSEVAYPAYSRSGFLNLGHDRGTHLTEDHANDLPKPESTDAVRLLGLARPPERPPDMGECCL